MTTATKARYVTGLCHSDRHLDCRGEYAGTVCRCDCHTAPPKPALAAVVDSGEGEAPRPGVGTAPVETGAAGSGGSPDLGDALTLLTTAVDTLDQALIGFDGHEIELCDLLGRVRTHRQKLADIESLIERDAARAMTGDLLEWPGGRAERRRGKDRKDWDHEALIRQVREAVIRPLILNVTTGELDRTTGSLIALALDAYADTNRPSWRTTKVRALGIDPDEFCTAVPGRATVQVDLGGAS